MQRFTMKIIIHEANGLQIGQRREDGYINLTKMAQANDKKINDYLRLDSTKAFLYELSTVTGIPASGKNALIQIHKGGNNKNTQGTWGHPQVAINCGQWCSAEFAVLVSGWVVEWMRTGQNPIAPDSTPTDLLAEINKLEKLIISIRSQSRIFHTGSHQPADAALFKALHTISHNQLGVINSAIARLQKLKQIAEMNSDLAINPDLNQESATNTVMGNPRSQIEPNHQPATPVMKDLTAANFIANIPVVTAKEATVRFTIDLPESMHRKLSILAAKTGQSKADILRLLLDDALEDV